MSHSLIPSLSCFLLTCAKSAISVTPLHPASYKVKRSHSQAPDPGIKFAGCPSGWSSGGDVAKELTAQGMGSMGFHAHGHSILSHVRSEEDQEWDARLTQLLAYRRESGTWR